MFTNHLFCNSARQKLPESNLAKTGDKYLLVFSLLTLLLPSSVLLKAASSGAVSTRLWSSRAALEDKASHVCRGNPLGQGPLDPVNSLRSTSVGLPGEMCYPEQGNELETNALMCKFGLTCDVGPRG